MKRIKIEQFAIILNLLIVALLGVIMRYKIVYEFPFLHQKNLQHAHSHFAFVAWISQCIFYLLKNMLNQRVHSNQKKLNTLMYLNIFFSYVMLFSFIWNGYWWLSILSSSVCTLISIFFSFIYYRELQYEIKINNNKALQLASPWINAAWLFNIISTLGTLTLSYLRMNSIFDQNLQLSAIYFYLHFQYNGFFAFMMIAIFIERYHSQISETKKLYRVFILMVITTLLNYGLSILWLDIHTLLYILFIISSILYFYAWISFSSVLNTIKITEKSIRIFYKIIWITILIKIILQTTSVIPFMSHLAYSLRSVVIAYLHLALLVITTSFLLFQFLEKSFNKIPIIFYIIFSLIIINEVVLGIHGLTGVMGIYYPNIHIILLIVSIAIAFSFILLIKKNFN